MKRKRESGGFIKKKTIRDLPNELLQKIASYSAPEPDPSGDFTTSTNPGTFDPRKDIGPIAPADNNASGISTDFAHDLLTYEADYPEGAIKSFLRSNEQGPETRRQSHAINVKHETEKTERNERLQKLIKAIFPTHKF